MKRTFGYIRKVSDDVEETRTIEFIASDESRDSHGTVLPVDKWDLERFNNNGIIGYQHNVYGDMCGNDDPDRVIGVGKARIEDGKLIVSVTFEPAELNQLAEKIFRKLLLGTLKAVSVGFAPTTEGKWGEGEESRNGSNPTYYFDGQELLELSVVNIPSNKNALKKSLRGNTVDAIQFIYKSLEGKYRYGQIEEMKVREVLDLLENRGDNFRGINNPEDTVTVDEGITPESDDDTGETEEAEQRTADADLLMEAECELALTAD